MAASWSASLVEKRTFLELRSEPLPRSRFMSDSMLGEKESAWDEVTSAGEDDLASLCSTDNWSTDNEDNESLVARPASPMQWTPCLTPCLAPCTPCVVSPPVWGFVLPVACTPVEAAVEAVEAPVRHRGGRPKKASPASLEKLDRACEVAEHERTTLIFRNVPRHWTRRDLTALLEAEGFFGFFDFAHVPVNFQDMANLGYALVNLVSNSEACRALEHFQGLLLEGEPCVVAWSSPSQGLQAHVERYQNSPMMHESVPEEYKPAIFSKGHMAPFPEPTKKLRAPRVRHPKAKDSIACA